MAAQTRVLLHNDQTDGLAASLAARFPDVLVERCHTYADLPNHIATFRPDAVYSVRFAGTPGFPRAALFGADGPRWVANGGAGTDHFGVWDPKCVTVTNAAGVAADMMAEYVMGGFLHFSLDVPGLLADQAAKVWAAHMVTPLKGKRVVIMGLGHTGAAIAARAKAFGMYVLGTRNRPAEMDNVDEVHGAGALSSLLPRADFVAVSTTLTAQTKGLIGVREIAAMKHGAVLADVSRGGVVDQRVLKEALREGRLSGAALDVFEEEPPADSSQFWEMPNVIISPHCSSVYEGWAAASFELFLDNLERFIAKEDLDNVVDPRWGY